MLHEFHLYVPKHRDGANFFLRLKFASIELLVKGSV